MLVNFKESMCIGFCILDKIKEFDNMELVAIFNLNKKHVQFKF
jgi:hypothetical protein